MPVDIRTLKLQREQASKPPGQDCITATFGLQPALAECAGLHSAHFRKRIIDPALKKQQGAAAPTSISNVATNREQRTPMNGEAN